MYFINTDHLFLKHLGEFFTTMETLRAPNNDDYITPIKLVGNMSIDNARVHGVLTN